MKQSELINDIIDDNGKVVTINNPAILKELKAARLSGKPFAEYDVLYRHYKNKIGIMDLYEWTELLKETRVKYKTIKYEKK